MNKYLVVVHGIGALAEIHRFQVEAESSLQAAEKSIFELTDKVLNPSPHHAWVHLVKQTGPRVADLFHYSSDGRTFQPHPAGSGILRPGP
jgi:hypothetical protein